MGVKTGCVASYSRIQGAYNYSMEHIFYYANDETYKPKGKIISTESALKIYRISAIVAITF